MNFVYIPEGTKVLTKSLVGFPTSEQFVPVATVYVQSVSSVATDGAFKVHAWTDHLSDSVDQGHLSHLNKWIRSQNATWEDGVDPTTTIVVNGGAIDDVYFSNLVGDILQLHMHEFPALDMQTGSQGYVVNDSVTAFNRITNLSDIDADSTGATLRGNNTYYSIVVFGVVNEDSTESKLFFNLPSGSYGSAAAVTADLSRFSNYTLPSNFKGTAFLIARISLRHQTASSGTITEIETEDLRGLVPSTSPGGGATGSASPGGASTNMQYNNSGVFAGSANMTFDGTNMSTIAPTSDLHVSTKKYVDDVITATTTVTSIDDTDSPYTALLTDDTILADATSGVITVNLPAASGNSGKTYNIKKTDASANAITIDGNASETIDGATTATISTQYQSLTVQCDGSNWHII